MEHRGPTGDRQALQARLIELLDDPGLNFADRYYGYYDERRHKQPSVKYQPQEFAQILAATGIAFTYDRREHFFGHKETFRGLDFVLNLMFPYSRHLEVVFAVKMPFGECLASLSRLGTRSKTMARSYIRV